MYLAKSGCYYVKAINGKPVFRSTQNLSEAARFETEEAAREHASNVFGGSLLANLTIVPEPTTTVATRPTGAGRLTNQDRFNDEPNMPWDHYMGR